MKKTRAASTPHEYVAALQGWQRTRVEHLLAAVRSAAPLHEVIKWGHLVFFSDGPVLLIRAEDDRVLLGFWRGQRLREMEPRLKPGGKYEMATLQLREGETIDAGTVRDLARKAVRLNNELGDPTLAAKTPVRSASLKSPDAAENA